MGMFQKGRSRTWLDDHGWWICVVEFQPSDWSRGSYLNVGCMWLWKEKDYMSFDEGNRVEPFTRFQEESQFEIEAARLTRRAADEVQRYRLLFPTVRSVCEFYLQRPPTNAGNWTTFHAGVACAMAGKPVEARRFFEAFLDFHGELSAWLVRQLADAQQLNTLAADTDSFRRLIASRVIRATGVTKAARDFLG